jgi:uncharacterized protein
MSLPQSLPRSRGSFHVLAKPIGPICNIDCEYCFYLKKKDLFPESKSFKMSDEVLENFTRQYIAAQPPGTQSVDFAWQGGEPTLMGVDFFRRAVELQQKYARQGMAISNSLQTNGTRLDDEWGQFLHKNNFLVGISIDGPDWIHNKFRKDKKGGDTYENVMRGVDVLRKHRVEFNTLTCVQDHNSHYAAEVYDFLTGLGSTFLQFIPIVEPEPADGVTYRSVKAEMYGHFLNGVLDRWLEKNDVGRVFVQDFDLLLGLVMGMPSSLCTHAETCGRSVAIEHTGEMFSCDHFVNREDQIGNVMEHTMKAMLDGDKQTQFGLDKREKLPQYCLDCEFLSVCNGGCPKDRIIETPDGEPGLHYLCEGFKIYYRHSIPVFEKMGECLRMGRPASDYKIIDRIKQQRVQAQFGDVGRNDPCPCGSGRKFKKCCSA